MTFRITSTAAIAVFTTAWGIGEQAHALTCLDYSLERSSGGKGSGIIAMLPSGFGGTLEPSRSVVPTFPEIHGQPFGSCEAMEQYQAGLIQKLLADAGILKQAQAWEQRVIGQEVIGQGIDAAGNPISFYPGIGWASDHEITWMTDSVSPSDVFASIRMGSIGQEAYDPREYEEREWVLANFDPKGILEEMRGKQEEARGEAFWLSWKAAGQTIYGVVFFESDRFKAAYSADVYEMLKGASDVKTALRPTLDALGDTFAEMKRANEVAEEARRRENYYSAEVGSDQRPTNLSYEMAVVEGYRYERKLANDTFVDGHGNVHETEVFQLPAENVPVIHDEELPA